MAKHKEIENLINKMLDREINDSEMNALKDHLSSCPDCRHAYEELCGVERSVRSLTEFFPARDFDSRVLAELGFAYRKSTTIKARLWQRLTGLIAAAWVVSLIGFLLSPLPRILLGKTLLSTPAVVNFFEKLSIIFTGLREIAVPFFKVSFDPVIPILGAIATTVVVYALGRFIHKKEETCNAYLP